MSEPAFDYGNKDLTVRAVQRFRGIATGWTVIVKGLRNELKAADRFLGGQPDGGAKVEPKVNEPADEESIDEAWRDLWELFEEARWLCARPETWPAKFGAGMRELLPVRERLALPGEWDAGTVFVSSDATKTMIAAIDWTNGLVMRMPAKAAATWVQQCGDDDEVAIHVAEMLSFLAFACHVGETWQGKVVLYGGDNQIVREWIVGRKAGTRTGRILVRLANVLEMRYCFVLVAAWWRTFHNVHADLLTRCTDNEFLELVNQKGWKVVDVVSSLRQAVADSERFGPCLLAWGEEDRRILMQLKQRRLKRALPQALSPNWESFKAVELCGPNRIVTDFVDAVNAAGGQCRRATWSGPVGVGEVVFASLPPDVHGKCLQAVTKAVIEGRPLLVILEGPRQALWEEATRLLNEAQWSTELNEYLTSEFGEFAVRRRKCLIATVAFPLENAFSTATSRSVLGPPMSAALCPAKSVPNEAWVYPDKLVVDAGIPREPLLPLLKGHYWLHGERYVLMSTGGPLRWPLREDEGLHQCLVWDPRGPPGAVRRLSEQEVWQCQGRDLKLWAELVRQGFGAGHILLEGSKATGGQTASALVLMAGYMIKSDGRAGECNDPFDDLNVAKLLEWLKRWKRGLFPRAGDDCRAGGHENITEEKTYDEHGRRGASGVHQRPAGAHHRRLVWRWGDGLWLDESSSDEDSEPESPRRAGAPRKGVRRQKAMTTEGAAHVQTDMQPVRPFNGDIGAHVEEWIEENMYGYHAQSTSRQYAGIYQKWKAWASRQGWVTEFLDRAVTIEANEDKLLGFLGYLGWLGASVATLKQAVFAIKDGHKRGGQGDPTEKMFRLWMLLGALEKRAPKKPRRLGVTPNMLIWIWGQMGPDMAATAEEAFDAIMVLAALNTAWFFMLRAKEYCESNGVDYAMVLRGADLKLSENNDPDDCVTLQFRKTKTDQEAFGTCKTMFRSGVKGLCVVSALRAFREIAPQRFGEGSEALKPLFRWANGQMLRRTQVQHLLQRAAAGVGLPPERFMSHSLRIGGASALFQATGEIELVKRTGRWSSAAVQRYLHDGERALKDAATKMATVEQKIHYT